MCYIDQLAPDNYTSLSTGPITAGGCRDWSGDPCSMVGAITERQHSENCWLMEGGSSQRNSCPW